MRAIQTGRRAIGGRLGPFFAAEGRGVGRENGHGHPELFDPTNDYGELLKVDRFDDIAIRVEIIRGIHVAGGLGGGEHDHGNGPQIRVALDLAKDFETILAGQVQVQQHDIRTGREGIGALTEEEFEGLLTVMNYVDTLGHGAL